MSAPRVVDNDLDEIAVSFGGREIRGWSYANPAEWRAKMLAAREFVEGWHYGFDGAAPSRPFWIVFTLLALWAAGCLGYGLWLLSSAIPEIGAPL